MARFPAKLVAIAAFIGCLSFAPVSSFATNGGINSVPARKSIFAKSSTSLNVFDPSSLVISDALSDAQEIASRLDGGGAILLVPILGGALVATILAWSIYAVSVPTVDEDA